MYGRSSSRRHSVNSMQTTDNSTRFTQYAVRRAWFAISGFAVWALAVAYTFDIYPYSVSITLFYALLLLNTFFSVRTFATVTPKEHPGQNMWDIVLGLLFMALPFVFSSPILFVFLTLLLFVTATLKYIFLIPVVGFSKLLFQKIRIDTLGILLCVLVLGGIIMGFPDISLIAWTVMFFIANVYVIWYMPLYRPENQAIKEFFNKP